MSMLLRVALSCTAPRARALWLLRLPRGQEGGGGMCGRARGSAASASTESGWARPAGSRSVHTGMERLRTCLGEEGDRGGALLAWPGESSGGRRHPWVGRQRGRCARLPALALHGRHGGNALERRHALLLLQDVRACVVRILQIVGELVPDLERRENERVLRQLGLDVVLGPRVGTRRVCEHAGYADELGAELGEIPAARVLHLAEGGRVKARLFRELVDGGQGLPGHLWCARVHEGAVVRVLDRAPCVVNELKLGLALGVLADEVPVLPEAQAKHVAVRVGGARGAGRVEDEVLAQVLVVVARPEQARWPRHVKVYVHLHRLLLHLMTA
mmetsp:Transcript_3486/g.9913  ORF Transcript_3486/g.9913 Transcript_3486/m.9913 type:complete len:330 (+) Transcript_3486:377-1366(+)